VERTKMGNLTQTRYPFACGRARDLRRGISLHQVSSLHLAVGRQM
jgi:hypothetical protein